MPQEPFGLRKTTLSAPQLRDPDLFRVPFIGLLRNMRITGRAPAPFHAGDIDILGGRKHGGIFRHLVVVKSEASSGFPPRIEREQGNRSVVAMTVDRPLGKDDVGFFAGQQTCEFFVVLFVDHGAPVVLTCECSPRPQNLARLFRFGGPDLGATAQAGRPAVSFAAVEIQENNLMAQLRITGHRTSATAFGVARMSAGHNDLQRMRGGLQRQGNRGGEQPATRNEGHSRNILSTIVMHPFRSGLLLAAAVMALSPAARPQSTDADAEKFAKRAARLWSLQPVRRPEVPAGLTSSTNPVDAFIAEKYGEKQLKPVGPADKVTLLRRVSYDLTGLPPTPEEQEAFLADRAPDAYEKVVDRLLADQQHGVRWARHWLDVLRYADADAGMPAASGIYLWRDWVISALNRDMPYDDFTRAQILGNRSAKHTTMTATGNRVRTQAAPEDSFALGFLARAALTGDNKEQDLALNSVETISTAFMGMTVGCAKCHDHKFDPIRQKDFYAMKALFDPLVLRKVVLATPADIFASGRQLDAYRAKAAPIEDEIEKLIAPYRTRLYDERVSMLTADVRAVIRKPEKARTPAEQKIADDYYPILRIDPGKIKEAMPVEDRNRYNALLKRQTAVRAPAELPAYWTVEEDSALLKEQSYVLNTGDPANPEKDKPVTPGFPFMPAGMDFREGRREGFVDWLTAPENPLFARVAVNRIWAWHFGEGLQRVPSDFGLLGGTPSNQKLLDYLASEFVSHGYSMKWLHKLIVTSDTYRLASKVEPDAMASSLKSDARDTYLWHFRLQRLEAEPVWDTILYTSKDLDLSVGGKSFQIAKADAKSDDHTNRRGIYIRRGYIPSTDVMANFLQAFDVDDGRTPCPIRTQTVTAPQALFSMNDDMIEKETQKFADRIMDEATGDVRTAVELAYKTALGRPPSGAEMDQALTYMNNDPARMKGFAWLLFNLDEFIYVR